MSEDDAPSTGDVLASRYRVGALIGAGGYGRVYRATDGATGREVAVKVVHAIDDELRARFAQEASIVQRLESPHTVRVLDHGATPAGAPFMVMELLEGISVFDLLERQKTISPRVALEITAQILDSLAEAHAMGVVHRDIKPENVFVTSRFGQPTHAKVLDFGIAKHGTTRKLTMQGQVVGTPSYMAPEQTTGRAVDARTDLYAVGLLLAEMVTGRTVMGTGGPMTIMVAQSKSEPVPLGDDVRRSIVGPVVERAVRKAPAERYPSATEMLIDVRALLADVNAASVGPTRVADPEASLPAAARPTVEGLPAHHTVASHPLTGSLPVEPPRVPPLQLPPAAPVIAPPPRAEQRKGGSLAVPLAIVAAAVIVSATIVGVATQLRRSDAPHRVEVAPRDDDDPGPPKSANVRRARTSDPKEVRRMFLDAGYKLTVDSGSAESHTFAVQKLPCVGTTTLMTLSDAATARTTAERIAASDTRGTVFLYEDRTFLSVSMVSSPSGQTDPACMASVLGFLAR